MYRIMEAWPISDLEITCERTQIGHNFKQQLSVNFERGKDITMKLPWNYLEITLKVLKLPWNYLGCSLFECTFPANSPFCITLLHLPTHYKKILTIRLPLDHAEHHKLLTYWCKVKCLYSSASAFHITRYTYTQIEVQFSHYIKSKHDKRSAQWYYLPLYCMCILYLTVKMNQK